MAKLDDIDGELTAEDITKREAEIKKKAEALKAEAAPKKETPDPHGHTTEVQKSRFDRYPDSMAHKWCPDCKELHIQHDACINCDYPLFGTEKVCPNCGTDQQKVRKDADGFCTNCHHDLLSKTALGLDDYTCPGCAKDKATGAHFKFKSDEAKVAFYKAKAAAAELEAAKNK